MKYLGKNIHSRISPRKKNYRWILKISFLLAALALAGYCYAYVSAFPIKEITLSSGGNFNDAELRAALNNYISSRGRFLRNNSMLIRAGSLRSALENVSEEIGTIDITKQVSGGVLMIALSPKEEVGIICNKGEDPRAMQVAETTSETPSITPSSFPSSLAESGCRWFDKNGLLLREAPDTSGSLVLKVLNQNGGDVRSASKILDAALISKLTLFKKKTRDIVNLEINYFLIPLHYYGDLIANIEGKFIILFDPASDPEKTLKNFKEVFTKIDAKTLSNIDRFDLTLENKVYIRSKGK